jgi:PAS domain-containing protein
MADTEQALADCVGAVYEAATGGDGWLDVGRRMLRLLDARFASLYFRDCASGKVRNLLAPPDSAEALYAAYFLGVDPYVAQARRDFATARAVHLGRAKVGEELVPDRAFLDSEYYTDFARPHQRRHMIGGLIGVAQPTPVGLFRGDDSEAFGPHEVRILEMLLPHIQRALELAARLSQNRSAASLTRAALDASSSGVVLVDAQLNVRFANDPAARMLAAPGVSLVIGRGGPQVGAPLRLVVHSRAQTDKLDGLVSSVLSGSAGGGLRISGREGADLAVLVSPTPRGLAADMAAAGALERTAMVVIRPLRPKASPPPGLLCDLFGLTRSEAEVAIALAGGGTAEDVARSRGVSLVTVRTQIRSILAKSESENLRETSSARWPAGHTHP